MTWRDAGRRARVPLIALLVVAALDARPATPAAAPGTLHFIATQEGTRLQGSFTRFAIALAFDPARPADATVHVQVALDSVDAGAAQANGLLRSTDFFDTATFPGAEFAAHGFRALPDGGYEALGTFSLKGRRTTLPVRFGIAPAPEGRWIDGSFVLSRLAYGIGQAQWSDTTTLDDAVTVRFHVLQGAGGS